jgi:RND family efflux transporter MFP subunit
MLIVIGAAALYWFGLANRQPTPTYIKTELPTIKTIKHTISTSGILELQDVMHIGSIQAGMVQDLCVTENQRVKKGQLLAIIYTGKSDTDVEANQHALERAQKELTYQKAYFERQKALYQAGQLAKDAYEKVVKKYAEAVEDVAIAKAQLRKSALEYESTFIRAPSDGIVVGVFATKGMVANDISNITLFDLAQDITKMKATLDIDESEIGHVKVGETVSLTPNCYPDLHITGTVTNVSFTPKSNNPTGLSSAADSSAQNYKATVEVDNGAMLLRPSMIVNATILVKKVRKVLSLNGMAFTVNPIILKKIAQKLHYTIKPIPLPQRQQLRKANQSTRFVWTLANDQLLQKAIVVGMTDNMYWEVLSGLDATDMVVVDTEEPNEMDAFYQQWFRGAL